MKLSSNTGRLVLNSGSLLKLAIIILVAVQLLSYYGAEWTITKSEWSTQITASHMAINNIGFVVARFCALALILIVFMASVRCTSNDVLWTFVVLAISVIHMIIKVMQSGFLESIYQSSMPLMYLLVFGFWIGQKQQSWKAVYSLIPALLCIYIAAFLITFISFYSKNGWAIFQNTSLMTYYSHAFALALPFLYSRFQRKKVGVTVYLTLLFFLMGAVMLRARSWMIQSVLLLLVAGVTAARTKGRSAAAFLRFFVTVSIITVAAGWLLQNYLTEFLDSIVEKGTTDSRSFQYTEMLTQTRWYDWIFGKGANATYVSKLYGEYQFIDNEFFYMSFHYGVIFAVLYFLPFLRTLFVSLRAGRRVRLAYFAAYCVLIWVISVNGLSVYHRIVFDVKSFVIPAFMGYLYMDMKSQGKEIASQ